jgi:hypothetical protein
MGWVVTATPRPLYPRERDPVLNVFSNPGRDAVYGDYRLFHPVIPKDGYK